MLLPRSLWIVSLLSVTLALSPESSKSTEDSRLDRKACQSLTQDPLEGCPPGTVLVASGQSVQSAVVSLSQGTEPAIILIEAGTYEEQVNITCAGPVYLLGQTSSPKDRSQNGVKILWRAVAGTGDNAFTSVLTVAPNLNASLTGSGPTGWPVLDNNPFGNTDFRAYNIDFVNDFAPRSSGPSLTVSTGYSNAGFYHCGFWSYQDTIYVGKKGSAYFHKSTIAGQTDFLYGFGTAWIQSSDLILRNCGGGITAWKGTNTSFVNKYGVYINDSAVKKENNSLSITGKCALGRPWNSQMRSIFANTYLDDSILPQGYTTWDDRLNNSTLQAEFNDFGPGFNKTARLAGYPITRLLTEKEWQPYNSPRKVFQYPDGSFGNYGWIDWGD